jgi:DNA polymerase III delta subunit
MATQYGNFVRELNAVCAIKEQKDFPPIIGLVGESRFLLTKTADTLAAQWHKLFDGEVITMHSDQTGASNTPLLGQGSLFSQYQLTFSGLIEKKAAFEEFKKRLPTSRVKAVGGEQFFVLTFLKCRNPENWLKNMQHQVIRVAEPAIQEWPAYSSALCKRAKVTISQNDIKYIIDLTYPDLGKLERTLEMLALVGPELQSSTRRHQIEEIIGVPAEKSVFALTEALLSRNHVEALKLLDRILDNGESSLAILGIISRHLRLLLKAIDRGQADSNGFYEEARLPRFVAKKYLEAGKRSDPKKLLVALDLCFSADIRLKSSRQEEFALLAEVLEVICQSS